MSRKGDLTISPLDRFLLLPELVAELVMVLMLLKVSASLFVLSEVPLADTLMVKVGLLVFVITLETFVFGPS